ncbi:MAG: hypothetical protein QE285_19600 [Aquabacterium sp.]|nr:hypothetical protein [Aquabacterium sp.]
MTKTLNAHKPRRTDDGRVVLTLLPSSYRTYHTSWVERGLRVACHAQIGHQLVVVVVQGAQLFLLQGQKRLHIAGLALADLQRMLDAPSESAYARVRVTLTPCDDSSPPAEPEHVHAPQLALAQALPDGAVDDGAQRFINRTAVTLKPRRLLVMPPRPEAAAESVAPARDRPPQVFRRPAATAPR